MEIFIMDENLNTMYNIDTFESLIWTERYNGCGNFELYTLMDEKVLEVAYAIQLKMQSRLECYAMLKEPNFTIYDSLPIFAKAMIIEELEITTDAQDGGRLIISGRGLESILDRRIIWPQTVLNGSLQEGVRKLMHDAILNPTDADRRLLNFGFRYSEDETIKSQKIKAQYTGDILYDAIVEICDAYGLGFDVYWNEYNMTFEFMLIRGEDRSYDQNENPYVTFSPKFNNLLNTDYLESPKTLKNMAVVAGAGEGFSRDFVVTSGSDSEVSFKGLYRRELYVDARDIQPETDDATYLREDYWESLRQRGKEKLSENVYTKAFTGEIDASKNFVYGRDFFIGDIVQIVNEYGMAAKARVSEIVRAQDSDGYRVYPTFQAVF